MIDCTKVRKLVHFCKYLQTKKCINKENNNLYVGNFICNKILHTSASYPLLCLWLTKWNFVRNVFNSFWYWSKNNRQDLPWKIKKTLRLRLLRVYGARLKVNNCKHTSEIVNVEHRFRWNQKNKMIFSGVFVFLYYFNQRQFPK